MKFPDANILEIDLTAGSVKKRKLDGGIYRKYPGGSSLAMYLLLNEMDPRIDPLSPGNMLIFSVSPTTGMPVSGQSRMNVAAKSPLTGGAGDSQVGGFIAAQLKGNGYDAVVVKGKAEHPVYIYIDKDNVEIKNAENVWGKTTGDAEKQIIRELKTKKIESSIIGQAGENQLRIANIMHQRSRANGRNGMGAVMGSKNMKALVVKKQRPLKPVLPEVIHELAKDSLQKVKDTAGVIDLTDNGTAGTVEVHSGEGFLPTRNWDSGVFKDADKIGTKAIQEKYLLKRESCYGCAVRCKGVVKIEGKVDPFYGGPEYETCAVFGSYCENDDLEKICVANMLCNMYGMDTISCGATIAWAMNCYEKGYLTKEETDGLELEYGHGELFEIIIPKMAMRTPGLGELLADGSAAAAAKLGKGEDLLVACKGQEAPAHMVQMKTNMAINYAVNAYGADHQSVEMDPSMAAPEETQDYEFMSQLGDFQVEDEYGVLNENRVRFTLATRALYAAMDTFCLCQFVWGPAWQLYSPKQILDLIYGATGVKMDLKELLEIGERRMVQMRNFNYLAGFTKKDDDLPPKMFQEIPDGPGKGCRITREDFHKYLNMYYEMAELDTVTGIPREAKLNRLEMDWLSQAARRDCSSDECDRQCS